LIEMILEKFQATEEKESASHGENREVRTGKIKHSGKETESLETNETWIPTKERWGENRPKKGKLSIVKGGAPSHKQQR